MAISSSSTQNQIVAAYLDNLNYDINESVSECRSFVAACRALLVMHPSNWSQSGANIQFSPELWQRQLDDAKSWLAANGDSSGVGSGGVSHLAFGEGFR